MQPSCSFTGLLGRVLVVALCLVNAHARAAADERTYPAEAWAERSAEKDSGWSREKLQAADKVASTLGTDAYLVVHRGAVVHRFGDVTRPLNVYSARKSVLSVLYGMYVDRGVIDLRQTLAELGIDDKGGLSAAEKSATVQQLLQARSGVYHEAAYEMPEMKAIRPPRGSHPPGEHWYYNNWDFNALGAIFRLRTGKSVFEALRDDLARPLQFQDFRYPGDTESVFEHASLYPAYVMKLSARDLARVGLLMARGGQWNGRPLVSARWVAESTTSYSTEPEGWQGYGYLWWVPEKAWPFWTRSRDGVFFANGNGGQYVFVDRQRDLVIVHQVRRSPFTRSVTPLAITPLLERILAASPAK
jgi:CubicO group peptidase (beta-lactamase class C family)